MSRALLANGTPIKRSQRRGLQKLGIKIQTGFPRNADPRTGKIIKRPAGRQS
jgi:hypothetical protein